MGGAGRRGPVSRDDAELRAPPSWSSRLQRGCAAATRRHRQVSHGRSARDTSAGAYQFPHIATRVGRGRYCSLHFAMSSHLDKLLSRHPDGGLLTEPAEISLEELDALQCIVGATVSGEPDGIRCFLETPAMPPLPNCAVFAGTMESSMPPPVSATVSSMCPCCSVCRLK